MHAFVRLFSARVEFKLMLLLPHSHIPLKNCAPIRKQYGNEVLGLTHSTKHVTVSELMELVEDIARVKKSASANVCYCDITVVDT